MSNIQINVGPPVLTVNQGNTFMVTDLDGQIIAETEQGLFSEDTRYVSYYAISANGETWTKLSSSAVNYHMARIHYTNVDFETEDGSIARNDLSLEIMRDVNQGVCEKFDLANYSLKKVKFNLEIALRSDFADIFEVRAHKFVRRGRIQTDWDEANRELQMTYENRDFKRQLVYRVIACDSQIHFANGRITFEIELAPGQTWTTACRYEFGTSARSAGQELWVGDESKLNALHKEWSERATKLTSQNEDIYRLYKQSVDDMGALRLVDEADKSDLFLPAAGVPWYVTVFGRDSLIISLQNAMVNCQFAHGALDRLAEFQAQVRDDERDAQPGKILHEIRFGELAHFNKIPHTPYYGSADSTPLYLIALHEIWKWTGDQNILMKYRDVALRCLEWIDNWGDMDGDGFQEYKTFSSKGYENMCWKDSPDSVAYPDGTVVRQPKAVCELQGYVYDSWLRMSEIFETMNDKKLALDLKSKAQKLKKQFDEQFWCEETQFYAYALDKDKNQVKTIASNVGHCLWSGIIPSARAPQVVQRLFEEDMWSGWGIRTLSSRHSAYNPNSYHNGSVWPHDNGIIAMGFKRYGFSQEASKVARDISEAASHFSGYRLPELYAGFPRRENTFPVQYLGANVPQGWAAGTVFHLLQAILGIRADAPNNKLLVNPLLPKWLPTLTLSGMSVGNAKIDLKFWRDGNQTHWDATVREGSIKVAQEQEPLP